MRFFQRLFLTSALASMAAVAPVWAAPAPADEVFLALRDAARANEATRVQSLAARWPASDDLSMYVEYYKLRVQIYDAGGLPRAVVPAEAIRAFLERYPQEAIADRLRNDWLLALGRQRDAATFDEQYALFALKDDPQVACYALGFRLDRVLKDASTGRWVAPTGAAREALADEVRAALRDPRQYNDGCYGLAEQAVSAGVLDDGDVWPLVQLAYAQNQLAAGRRMARLLDDASGDAIEQVAERGKAWLAKASLKTPAARQTALLALVRIARTDPAQAAQEFERIALRFGADERAQAWSAIAEAASRKAMAEAYGWFRLADAAASAHTSTFSPADETLRWQARAALRSQDWAMVRRSIERMSAEAMRDATWSYWLARALREQGEGPRAEALLRSIAGEFSFYGKLASEDLGLPLVTPPAPRPVTADELAGAQGNAGLRRALRFYAMDLRFEGNREWNWQLRGMSDRQLLAAAEFARRENVIDRAINTAERTRSEHDFNLRFLAPFRDVFARSAAAAGLDDAWVYGLVRQESRFILRARSGVGASGLMQLMPATAKWVARKIGLADYHPGRVTDLETNVLLGTSYLRMVYDDLDSSPVLASAAYNAGPGRSRQWRSTLPRPVEGAIFAETIPFSETRDYVKKVLSNAVYYAALFQGTPQSLKSRLGVIAPREAGRTDLP